MSENTALVAAPEEKDYHHMDPALMVEALIKAEALNAACIESLECCIKHTDPQSGEYHRGLYNGLLTAVAIMTGQEQTARMKAEPVSEIVIAQVLPANA